MYVVLPREMPGCYPLRGVCWRELQWLPRSDCAPLLVDKKGPGSVTRNRDDVNWPELRHLSPVLKEF